MKGSKRKMIKERFTIAGGNTTLLVEGCPVDERIKIAKEAINKLEAEQVGFIKMGSKTQLPELLMMGGELCINALIAFARKLASLGKPEGFIVTSGLPDPVQYYQLKDETRISFPLKVDEQENRLGIIVRFPTIGYLVTNQLRAVREDIPRELCYKTGLPAFGLAMNSGDSLTPYVYVKETDTLVSETACGSGSIAVLVASRRNWMYVTQTITGQRIYVQRLNGNQFTVGAKVVKMR